MIDHRISAPDHGREVVDRLNGIYESFMLHLMSTVQLHVSKRFDT